MSLSTSIEPIGLLSLRGGSTFGATAPATVHTHRISAASVVTILRAPIATLGIIQIFQGATGLAIAAFTVFAFVDILDGSISRYRGEETAVRRILDVLIDRVSIHAAAIALSIVHDLGWVLPAAIILRDLVQASYSARLIKKHRRVVVGPHSHMAYGLTMLAWGCSTLLTGEVSVPTTVVMFLVSAVVLVDYIRRCEVLQSRIQDDRG